MHPEFTPPLPYIRPSRHPFDRKGPCPVCLYVVTLAVYAKQAKKGQRWRRWFEGACPRHGSFTYTPTEYVRAWQRQSQHEEARRLMAQVTRD